MTWVIVNEEKGVRVGSIIVLWQRNVLGTFYPLRCQRLDNIQPAPSAYYNRANACQGGRVTEGIVLIRGQLTHKITKRYATRGDQRPKIHSLCRGCSRVTGTGDTSDCEGFFG